VRRGRARAEEEEQEAMNWIIGFCSARDGHQMDSSSRTPRRMRARRWLRPVGWPVDRYRHCADLSSICSMLPAPMHAAARAMPVPRGYPARPPHGVHGIARVVPMGACTYILYTKQCFMGEKSMHNN
jgi:hypothetical protein